MQDYVEILRGPEATTGTLHRERGRRPPDQHKLTGVVGEGLPE